MDKAWEEVHSKKDWGKYPSIDVVSFVARNYYTKDRKNIKILDYGCGQGANTWFSSREGFDTYAFDGSPSAIEKAKNFLKEQNLKADFKIMLGTSLEYPSNFFDCVIDGAVISANLTTNIKTMLSEIYRVLKNGGKMISTGLFNDKCTSYGTGDLVEKNTYTNINKGTLQGIGAIHFFERQEIIDLWSEAGFKNINIDENILTINNGTITTGSYIVTAEK